MPICVWVRQVSKAMRVTIQDREAEQVTLKIEGKVAGLQVPELDRAWQILAPSLGTKRLQVDLRGVTHVDNTGRSLLAEIHAVTGAEFMADTPLTKYFAQVAQHPVRALNDPDAEIRRGS
jgi:ABC-type transporter Mla MlaB component